MIKTAKKIDAFVRLGELLRSVIIEDTAKQTIADRVKKEVHSAYVENPWFTPDNIRFSLKAIADNLSRDSIEGWFSNYAQNIMASRETRNVAVVMAGNIPMVGFHDFFYVLMSGHRFVGKLSSRDKRLMPLIGDLLMEIEPAFQDQFEFTDSKIKGFDAVIATGSDNSSRYFEYYFGKYPHIIRKNRNGVAVISGHETSDDLEALGLDVFTYFGLGCRNVSKVYVPAKYGFGPMLESFQKYAPVIEHDKYKNNYDYNKSIFLVNKMPFRDNGFILLKRDEQLSSPISVLHYSEYDDLQKVRREILHNRESIQCVVSNTELSTSFTPLGTSQFPRLNDYADDVDVMQFLLDL